MSASGIRWWKGREVVGKPKVSVVAACYLNKNPRRIDTLMTLLYCFRSQTYPNWEAIIVHDGPVLKSLKDKVYKQIECMDDPRIKFIETEERKQAHGHPWRQFGIDQATGDYIGLTNDDNYYAPVYFEWMLHIATKKNVDFVYCNMIHNYRMWDPFPSTPRRGGLDLGAWIASAKLVKSTPFKSVRFAADGDYINALVKKAKGIKKINAYLFTHN